MRSYHAGGGCVTGSCEIKSDLKVAQRPTLFRKSKRLWEDRRHERAWRTEPRVMDVPHQSMLYSLSSYCVGGRSLTPRPLCQMFAHAGERAGPLFEECRPCFTFQAWAERRPHRRADLGRMRPARHCVAPLRAWAT